MDKKILGNEIRRLRKNKNMTQIELAHDICNQSEISRLEKGAVFPSIDVLHLIANKLNVSTFHFFEILIHDNLIQKNELTEKILYFCKNKNYIEVFEITKSELNKKEFHPEFRQFLIWQYYIASYYLKKINIDTCLIELKLLLNQKVFGTNLLQVLFIENSIANLYAEKRRYKDSIKHYNAILEKKVNSIEYDSFSIKVLYNLSKVLYFDNQIELSLTKANQAIDLSCKNHDMSLLGQAYFQKAECLEKLNYNSSEISNCYSKSLFFFKLLNLNYYENIILEKKQQYLD